MNDDRKFTIAEVARAFRLPRRFWPGAELAGADGPNAAEFEMKTVNEIVAHAGRTYRVALAPGLSPPKALLVVRRSKVGTYDVGHPLDPDGKIGAILVEAARAQFKAAGGPALLAAEADRKAKAKALRLSTNMIELLHRIGDDWSPLLRYFDQITWRALRSRGLVEIGTKSDATVARKTPAGKEAVK